MNSTQISRRSFLHTGGLALAAAGAGLSFPAAPREPPGEAFTLAFMTDTHLDMKCSAANLRAMSEWIARQASDLNIRFVAHQGDVGDRRGSADIGEMLRQASSALQPIRDAGVPLSVAIGNHDYDSGSDTRPCHAFNRPDTFGVAQYAGTSGFGGTFEAEEGTGPDPGGSVNHYFTQVLGERPFLFITLELFPRDKVMAWASGLVHERFSGHEVVVVTHAYINRWGDLCEGFNYDGFSREEGPEYTNDGVSMWRRYFRTWKNLRLVMSGHFIDAPRQNYLPQTGEHGNLVHSHYWNYQNWGYQNGALYNIRGGGEHQAAFIKLVCVDAGKNQVTLRNYVPSARVAGEEAYPDRYPYHVQLIHRE
jgi:hypothetical protein